MSAGAGFSALIAVGGKPIELERLTDTLESLVHYEPDVGRVVVIDDFGGRYDVMAAVPTVLRTRAVVLPNPRNGRGSGWGSGLTAGILHGLRWLACQPESGFVLKIDTDTLVINCFRKAIDDKLSGDGNLGMLGSFTRTPNRLLGEYNDFYIAHALRKLMWWAAVWRRTYYPWPYLQCSLFRRARIVRKIIKEFLAQGFHLGQYCLGGGYAVSRNGLLQLLSCQRLDDPLLWLWTPVGEDCAVSMSVLSCGLRAEDFNRDGEPFGVQTVGLPASPATLVSRGFSIIHSVKDFGGQREAEVRAFFRHRREAGRHE